MADVKTSQPDTLSARDLAKAFIFATDWLGVFIDQVNALNVYPVPDGDTGTNMHLTLQSVRRQLHEEDPRSMAKVGHALAYGSLLGARGNSGVILSQILKGFAEVIRKHPRLSGSDVAEALVAASRSAYAAVMKPVEGTILTVVRRASEAASSSGADTPLEILRDALEAGRTALEETPTMLPILAEAGVVDAGGLGFLYMLEGVLGYFEGRDLPSPPEVTRLAQQQFEEEQFGYCTEFLISDVKVPTAEIQQLVEPFGDSLLVVGAEGYVKGHIHTEEPERLLVLVSRYGRMVRSKVEDMSEQHSEILANVVPGQAAVPATGLVAVAAGYGPTRSFRSLGARVVGGGQTNNPSVQDIADAVRSLGAYEVIVLPNNKNIIMAAERVDELLPDKRVHVLPTRSVGQGLAAAVLFDKDGAAEALLQDMAEAIEGARTLEVTTASRTATIGKVSVQLGDYIGLMDGELAVSAATPESCLLALLEQVGDEVEVGTLFYSSVFEEAQVRELQERLEAAFDYLEIQFLPGAPELYPYVMALE